MFFEKRFQSNVPQFFMLSNTTQKGKQTGFWKIYSEDDQFYNQGKFKKGEAIGWRYFTDAETGTKLDGLKYNGKGQCVEHATMKW